MNRLVRYGRKAVVSLTILAVLFALIAVVPQSAMAAVTGTTSITITKLASDGTTVLEQRTVTYQELRDGILSDGTSISILGDGATHYYHQGPVFKDDPDEAVEQMLRWNPEEDTNILTKDMGAVKGTNIKDLCDLVGGMADGDTLKIKASDGFNKTFAYKNVYGYSPREGPMAVCWYKDGLYPDTGYTDGMRLVWFADDSTNTLGPDQTGVHAFGNWDWYEAAAPEYWYYWWSGSEKYPTTTGLSVQMVSELIINSNESPPPKLSSTEVTTKGDISLTFDKPMADPTGIGAEGQFEVFVDGNEVDVTAVVKTNTAEKIKLEMATDIVGGQTVTAAYTKSADAGKQIKSTDGGVLESFSAVNVTNSLPVAPAAAFTADQTSGTAPLTVSFTDASTGTTPLSWAWDFNNDGTVDSTVQNPAYQYIAAGTYSVKLTVTNAAGSDDEVKTDYITVSPAPVAPAAAFTADVTSGTAPLTVNFTDASTGTTPLSWAWDFDNDGTVDSTEQNPSYQYTEAGTYSVKLTVTNDAGSDDETKTDYITVSPAPVAPAAAFTADVTSGTAPLTVSFTDASTGTTPLSWAWDFDNDGTVDSTEQNPSYQYTEAGTYSVKLTVTNDAGSDDEVKAGYIKVIVYADFPIQLIGETTINMSKADMEALLNTEKTYTDGNGNVFAGVPLQQLVAKVDDSDPATLNTSLLGTYNIVFTGLNQDGTDYARTAAAGNWSGYFTGGSIQTNDVFIATKVKIGGTGDFVDLPVVSVNNASKNWRPAIVSGSLISGSGNRIGGLYKIELTGITPVAPAAAFTADVTSGTAPLTVSFTDQSTGTTPLSWAWDFNNDGTVDSTEQNPSYQYAEAGTYSVKLTVTNDAGSDDETKTDYITVSAAPVAPAAAFTADMTSGTAPLTVQFTDQSTGTTPLSWAWDFDNDGTVDSTDQNPAHQYSTAGAYSVKLTVTNDAGSDEELKASYITLSEPPTIDVLYDGTVNLTPGETFNVTAKYLNTDGTSYTVSETTPLGALQATGISYAVTDKRWNEDGVLMLDDVGAYLRNNPGKWYAYVNDVYKDGYMNQPAGLNVIELADGDKVEFYYAAGMTTPADLNAVKAAATAAVKTIASVEVPPTMDVLYDGTVNLTPGETFKVTAYNSSAEYTVSETTPLGALHAAATVNGFTYDVTDKNYLASGALLLDNVGSYPYVKGGSKWYAYVNDAFKDGYNNAAGALNLIELVNGDKVEFYYAAGIADATDLNAVKAAATAAVKTVASTGVAPTDWTLQLSGAKNQSVTKSYFEDGLACANSGHYVEWTDADGNVWGGVPLWLLVGMVDDDPDVGPYHFNFNDDLAAQNYEVNVVAGDGFKATLQSAAIARNDGYIVANTLNGDQLPLQTEGGKPCWPLHLKGSAVLGGDQVGNIVRIELTGLPQPPEGWTLEMVGEVGDTITQEEFEEGLACTGSGHLKQWTDINGNVWSGVPLWVLLGAVDDIETSSHWTFNDALAAGYSVNVAAGDYSRTFAGADVARSDDYIVANKVNGAELTDGWPLRLVGNGVTKLDGSLGGSSVANIDKIEIPELMTPEAAPGSWNLALYGKISDVISQAEFEDGLACPNSGHYVEWTDKDNNVWSGIPLWFLTGWVDDRLPHDYNTNQAEAGYTVLVKAEDGYTREFASTDVAWSNSYIIANKINGEPLDETSWPLRLVGTGVSTDGALSGTSVRNIAEIELTAFNTALPIPKVRIVKYAEDRATIVDEMTVDYQWMQSNLDVIGDGTTVYRYEGITNNPDDVWDSAETYPGGYKIQNAVKGTSVKDLCDLVGGMGAGTEIVFVAKDGYETTLPYSSIYTDPSVQERQGDAILAWWADGKYVPYYADGMRLFFTPGGDNVYGQWDMHETLPSNYWHYYYSDNVQYPSCAGLSPKYIETIEIYSVPAGEWTLALDGTDIGGLQYDVSKTYFEQALACQFGADHKATYTDTEGKVWEGMPLWFLAGFVDDADQHSDNSFNDALAAAGYQVVITADDGDSVTIDSKDIIRNTDYIVANTLNGALIPDTDSSWPLRLVGPAVDETTSISKIVRIELVNTPSTELPVAAFTGTPTSGEAPLTVQFTDQSTNSPTSWSWDFDNDGSVDSAEQNPSYEYTAAGTYSVKLTVTNSAGSDDEVKADYITVSSAPIAPEASFTADTTSGEAPLTVQFTDQSTNSPTSWAWDFDNDGLVDSTEQNPSCEYSAAGTFSVRLTVTNSAGSDDVLKTGYITVSSASLLAPPDLSSDTTTVGKAIDITFTDNAAWRRAVTGITVDGTALSNREYKIAKGKINIVAGVFTAAGDYEIVVSAAGYEEAGVTQSMETGAPPVLNADTSNNTVGQTIDITFTDNAAWRAAVTDITVDGNSIAGNYTIGKGKIRIAASVFSAAGEYEITVLAGGYDDTSVIQTLNNAKGKKK